MLASANLGVGSMTERAFQDLLADFFREAGSNDAHALLRSGHCRCAGKEVALYYDDRIDAANVHAYVDFGLVARHRQADVFRALLSCTPKVESTHSAIVGLDGTSDRIILVARITFDPSLSGRRLATIINRMIQEVGGWVRPSAAMRVRTGKPRAQRRPS